MIRKYHTESPATESVGQNRMRKCIGQIELFTNKSQHSIQKHIQVYYAIKKKFRILVDRDQRIKRGRAKKHIGESSVTKVLKTLRLGLQKGACDKYLPLTN